MGKYEKVLFKVLQGTSDSNIQFSELCGLLKFLGFQERIKGSHHNLKVVTIIYWKEDVTELANIQPRGGKAKPYQVWQIRNLIFN